MRPLVTDADAPWIARVEAARAEETRRCGGRCGETLPLSAFVRNRLEQFGRGYYCLPCWRHEQDKYRTRRALRAIGLAS